MNKADRKKVAQIVGNLETALEDLRELADNEQDKFDNLSEGLQSSDKGQEIEEAASTLSSVRDDLEMVISNLEELS